MHPGVFAHEIHLRNALEHHQAGRLEVARQEYEATLALQPDEPQALMGLGIVAVQLGETAIGLPYLEAAAELAPHTADCWINLTNAYRLAERFEDGVRAGQQAVLRAPERAGAWSNWAACLRAVGRVGDAVTSATTATEVDRDCAEAWRNLGAARLDLGEAESALNAFYQALRLQPEHAECWSNVLFAAQYVDGLAPETLAGLTAAFGRTQPSSDRPAKPEAIQRIGFVSGDFRGHPVGRFLTALLPVLSARGIQIALIKNQPADDETTAELERYAMAVVDVWGKDTDAAYDAVTALCLDVAIDLSGHSSYHRLDLFAERLAPRQYTWLGYSAPTGVPAMDGWIVGANMLPPQAPEAADVEQVITLDGPFLVDRPGNAKATPAPCAAGCPVTFGSFNNPAKIGPRTRAMWATLLHALSESRLLMKYRVFDDPETCEHWRTVWEEYGIEPERIEFRGWTDVEGRHFDFSRVDLALDPWPYSGATTTLDLLRAGVPVVTLAGDRYASRMSASFLEATGHSDWIAHRESEFVAICERLISQPEELTELRLALPGEVAASPICDAEAFADAFLRALEAAP